MKKKLYGGLTAVLALCLTFTLAGCKDDKEPSEEEKQQQAEEQADKDMADAATFWSVVGQLTDTPMPDNWQNATYEPSIGEPDGTNSAVRIVNCADEESAAASASDLLGTSITTATQSYTYQNDLVGTLTYHKTGGSSLATVDVSIQQMPGLSQIVYKTPEQIGENASFKGTAYYRFGDVVKKLNKDGEYDYWICVRPCLSFVSKTDSHWMTLSKLPSDYLKSQEKTVNGNKFKHQMPKNLANNSDHMQNMAEMVYAMTCPTDWATNLSTNKGYQKLKYFKDLNYEKYFKYNNEWFFTKVANGWEAHDGDLFQTIFGLSREDLKAHVQAKGFAMVYGNATISSNDITLTVYKYDGTNLKTKSSVKSTGKWDYAAFDINQLMSKHYIDNDMVVPAEDGRYWVARYATGETLAKGADATKFDKQKKLPNCEDVFVYNQKVDHLDMTEETLKATEPKVVGEHGNEKGYYQLGDIVKYKKRLYICASDHDFGETARFITLNDQTDHSTGTFEWSGIGRDTVYTDDMASSQTLFCWVKNVLYNNESYNNIRTSLQTKGIETAQWNQVIPETDHMRFYTMHALQDSYHLIVDLSEEAKGHVEVPSGVFAARMFTNVIYHENEDDEYDPAFDENAERNIYVQSCAPVGFLLADKMRYSTHLIDPTDHWVPYIFLLRDKDGAFQRFKDELDNIASITTLSTSHFKWTDLGTFEVPEKMVQPPTPIAIKSDISAGTYHVLLLATYWKHEVVKLSSTKNANLRLRLLMNYAFDWSVKSETFQNYDFLWNRCNITSREYVFTDDGKKQSKLESVIVSKEQ